MFHARPIRKLRWRHLRERWMAATGERNKRRATSEAVFVGFAADPALLLLDGSNVLQIAERSSGKVCEKEVSYSMFKSALHTATADRQWPARRTGAVRCTAIR